MATVLKYRSPAVNGPPLGSRVGSDAKAPRYVFVNDARLAAADAADADALLACVVAIPAWVVAVDADVPALVADVAALLACVVAMPA